MTTPMTHTPAEALEVDAEIQRVAKLLGLSRSELEYLHGLPAVELRALRQQVTSSLFDNQTALERIAATTRIVPAPLVASLAEKVFGPVLAARIAGLVDPDKAIDIAARLPTPFLADVAVELDPRRVASILSRIPARTVGEVTALLVTRGQWVAMGTFLAYLPPDSIRAAMAEMDGHALLQVALVLDDKAELSGLIETASGDRLPEIAAAAEAEGLTEQFAVLSTYFTIAQQEQL